jgi:GNAT superfamily N-acetyltransferase
MKSSLTTSLISLEAVPWLDDLFSKEESTTERKLLGHARPQIERNLTYSPLREELASSLFKNKRIYSAIEVSKNESTASAFFRCFPKLDLITLDLIYVPKVHRGHGIGYNLLAEMTGEHSEQHSVHLILDYANRKAFESSAGESLTARLLKVPTLRNLKKIGFTKVTHLGGMKIPGDHHVYPEVVLTQPDAVSDQAVVASLD